METKGPTECVDCEAAPSLGLAASWRPIDEPGPAWTRGSPLHRCIACHRVWYAPYDPREDLYYRAMYPLSHRVDAVLRPDAGLAELLALLDDDRSDGAHDLADKFLRCAWWYSVDAAVPALASRIPIGGGIRETVSMLLLVNAALSGPAGEKAFRRVRAGGVGVRVSGMELLILGDAMDRVAEATREGQSGALVVRSLRDHFASRLLVAGE